MSRFYSMLLRLFAPVNRWIMRLRDVQAPHIPDEPEDTLDDEDFRVLAGVEEPVFTDPHVISCNPGLVIDGSKMSVKDIVAETVVPKDKYQESIDRLTAVFNESGKQAFREAVVDAWYMDTEHSPLFDFIWRNHNQTEERKCCLSQLRTQPIVGKIEWESLRPFIVADERIPKDVDEITVESLPAFAEWQRLFDVIHDPKDVYDREIQYLCSQETFSPDIAWGNPDDNIGRGGSLFLTAVADPSKNRTAGWIGQGCGCPVFVHHRGFSAENRDITEQMRADNRIPLGGYDIMPLHLPVFAEWRRKLDALRPRPRDCFDDAVDRLPAIEDDAAFADMQRRW